MKCAPCIKIIIIIIIIIIIVIIIVIIIIIIIIITNAIAKNQSTRFLQGRKCKYKYKY